MEFSKRGKQTFDKKKTKKKRIFEQCVGIIMKLKRIIKEEMVDFSVTKEGGSRNSKIIAFHFEFPAVEDVLDD